MTNQQLFGRVARHLLKQGRRSVAKHPYVQCAYYGGAGLKCAIGCLIPKSRYRPALEGLGVHERPVRIAAGITERQRDLAEALQLVHDDSPPRAWRTELQKLAGEYGLKMPRGDA